MKTQLVGKDRQVLLNKEAVDVKDQLQMRLVLERT